MVVIARLYKRTIYLFKLEKDEKGISMLARDAKIYKDTESLADMIFNLTKSYRSDYRATLARKTEECVLMLADLIVAANLSAPTKRIEILGNDFVIAYERLQFLIRLALRQKQISLKQQAQVARLMDGIGKQATGWRKSAIK